MTDEREEPEWVPDRREVAPELERDYQHETYPPAPTVFNPISDQINAADRETLRLYVAGVTAPGAWRNTELGGE